MIETERLLLRPWVEADRAPFAAIVADPEVNRWLGGERVQGDAYFDSMVAFWREHGHGAVAVMRKSDDILIGRVGCRRMPAEWNHPTGALTEVGWLLAREAWGYGYASEAAAAMLAWGFASLPVAAIHSWTAAENLRSQAVMRRIGMVRAPALDFDAPGVPEDDPQRAHVVYVTARPAGD